CSPAAAYQWQLNTVDIPGATQQSYTYSQTGLYTVLAYDSNGCSNYANWNITAVENVLNDFSASVFRNPSDGKFTVQVISQTVLNSPLRLQIENSIGQIVFSSKELPALGSFKKEIDLHNIPGGVYSISLLTNNCMWKRIISIIH